jgi:hypothetical protein
MAMDENVKRAVWNQFGGAIDMLDDALSACPEELWQATVWDDPEDLTTYSEFWYLAYHTLFWLDFYLSNGAADFAPPSPFTLDELDPAGLLPERPYTKAKLQAYLQYGRRKCQATISGLTDEQAQESYKFRWGDMPFFELLFYNLRHVQEHAAQLNLMLGQKAGVSSGWVARARQLDS